MICKVCGNEIVGKVWIYKQSLACEEEEDYIVTVLVCGDCVEVDLIPEMQQFESPKPVKRKFMSEIVEDLRKKLRK